MAITDGTVGKRAYLRGPELRWAGLSLVISIVLLAIKLIAYFLTGSQAIYSDAVENIANVATAAFAVYAIRLAHRPADVDHPYGHGKIEFFSAGLEGAMVLLAAALIVGKIGTNLLSQGSPVVRRLDAGIVLMTVALVVNGLLGLSLLWRGRMNKSITLEASGVHLMVDALDSLAVLMAVALVKLTGREWIDPLAALAVAVYIALTGLKLIKRSTAGLMDEQDPADIKLLRDILGSHLGANAKDPRICSYHKLRLRHSGRNHWVDFHIMVPGHWDIEKGHNVASVIEHEIELALVDANATAHVEPCNEEGCGECGTGAKSEIRNSKSE
jgi:cation diffusion facilitator family transporter